MPWKSVEGGYTTKRGGFVRNPAQYEKLKAKYGKARAAAITNSVNKSLIHGQFVPLGQIPKHQRQAIGGYKALKRVSPRDKHYLAERKEFANPSQSSVKDEFKSSAGFTIRRGSKSHGQSRVFIARDIRGAEKKSVKIHEAQHANPKRSEYRLHEQIATNPVKSGREEARADYRAGGHYTTAAHRSGYPEMAREDPKFGAGYFGMMDTLRAKKVPHAGVNKGLGQAYVAHQQIKELRRSGMPKQVARQVVEGAKRAKKDPKLTPVTIKLRDTMVGAPNYSVDKSFRDEFNRRKQMHRNVVRARAYRNAGMSREQAVHAIAVNQVADQLKAGGHSVQVNPQVAKFAKKDNHKKGYVAPVLLGVGSTGTALTGGALASGGKVLEGLGREEAKGIGTMIRQNKHRRMHLESQLGTGHSDSPFVRAGGSKDAQLRSGIRQAEMVSADHWGALRDTHKVIRVSRKMRTTGKIGAAAGAVGLAGATAMAIRRYHRNARGQFSGGKADVAKADRKKQGYTAPSLLGAGSGAAAVYSGSLHRRAVEAEGASRKYAGAVKDTMRFNAKQKRHGSKAQIIDEKGGSLPSQLKTAHGYIRYARKTRNVARVGLAAGTVGLAGAGAMALHRYKNNVRNELAGVNKADDKMTKREHRVRATGLNVAGSLSGALAGAHIWQAGQLVRHKPKVAGLHAGASGLFALGSYGALRSSQRHAHLGERKVPDVEKSAGLMKSYRSDAVVAFGKRDNQQNRSSRTGVITGVGATTAAGGLVGGGIPGAHADLESIKRIHRGSTKQRIKASIKSGQGGVFGYRADAHQSFHAKTARENARNIATPETSHIEHYMRGVGRGKMAPERTIIRNMRAGRKASNIALIGGAGLAAYGVHRMHNENKIAKAQSNTEHYHGVLAGSGAALAGGSVLGARKLEQQGRKWSTHSADKITEAARIAPNTGLYTKKKGVNRRVPDVVPDYETHHMQHDPYSRLHGDKKVTEAAGKLHGEAGQARYFARIYGKTANAARKVGLVGGATAAIGATGLALSRRKKNVAKAYWNTLEETDRQASGHRRKRKNALGATAVGGGIAAAPFAHDLRGGKGLSTGTQLKYVKHAVANHGVGAGARTLTHSPKAAVALAGGTLAAGAGGKALYHHVRASQLQHQAASRRKSRYKMASGSTIGKSAEAFAKKWVKDEDLTSHQHKGKAIAYGAVGGGTAYATGMHIGTTVGMARQKTLPYPKKLIATRAGIGAAGAAGTGLLVRQAIRHNKEAERKGKLERASKSYDDPLAMIQLNGFDLTEDELERRYPKDFAPEDLDEVSKARTQQPEQHQTKPGTAASLAGGTVGGLGFATYGYGANKVTNARSDAQTAGNKVKTGVDIKRITQSNRGPRGLPAQAAPKAPGTISYKQAQRANYGPARGKPGSVPHPSTAAPHDPAFVKVPKVGHKYAKPLIAEHNKATGLAHQAATVRHANLASRAAEAPGMIKEGRAEVKTAHQAIRTGTKFKQAGAAGLGLGLIGLGVAAGQVRNKRQNELYAKSAEVAKWQPSEKQKDAAGKYGPAALLAGSAYPGVKTFAHLGRASRGTGEAEAILGSGGASHEALSRVRGAKRSVSNAKATAALAGLGTAGAVGLHSYGRLRHRKEEASKGMPDTPDVAIKGVLRPVKLSNGKRVSSAPVPRPPQ